MSLRTSGSFGWTGVLVMRCQNVVRSRTAWGSVAHGAAAVNVCPRSLSGEGAIVASALWTIFGSSYIPGTLALSGSPLPSVLKMKYCALVAAPQAGAGLAASARRGLARNAAGSPVARARRPMPPAPNSVESSACRRVSVM